MSQSSLTATLSNRHGGTRAGAGRKRLGGEPRASISVSLPPDLVARLRERAAETGVSLSEVLTAIALAEEAGPPAMPAGELAELAEVPPYPWGRVASCVGQAVTWDQEAGALLADGRALAVGDVLTVALPTGAGDGFWPAVVVGLPRAVPRVLVMPVAGFVGVQWDAAFSSLMCLPAGAGGMPIVGVAMVDHVLSLGLDRVRVRRGALEAGVLAPIIGAMAAAMGPGPMPFSLLGGEGQVR